MDQTDVLTELFTRELDKLIKEVRSYPDDSLLWVVEGEIKNSAGNLCLHLVGNLNHFIGSVLGQTGFVRDRPAEFSTRFLPSSELISSIESTKLMVNQTIGSLTDSQLKMQYPEGYFNADPMTIEWFLMHLYGHLCYHLGQINYHKRLTGPNLQSTTL